MIRCRFGYTDHHPYTIIYIKGHRLNIQIWPFYQLQVLITPCIECIIPLKQRVITTSHGQNCKYRCCEPKNCAGIVSITRAMIMRGFVFYKKGMVIPHSQGLGMVIPHFCWDLKPHSWQEDPQKTPGSKGGTHQNNMCKKEKQFSCRIMAAIFLETRGLSVMLGSVGSYQGSWGFDRYDFH